MNTDKNRQCTNVNFYQFSQQKAHVYFDNDTRSVYVVNCYYTNAQSIVNKMDEFTETWANAGITDAFFKLPEYELYRSDTRDRVGGGAILMVHKSIYHLNHARN